MKKKYIMPQQQVMKITPRQHILTTSNVNYNNNPYDQEFD